MVYAAHQPVEAKAAAPSIGLRPGVKAAALIMGSSVFAYLFAVTVHEVGHYLGNVTLGVPETRIVLHPLDLSYTTEGGDLSTALGTPMRQAFSSAAGPLLNLILGVSAGLLLWHRRSPRWLPLLMWAPLALIQEGVGMIIGLVDHPEIESDWVSVMFAGVSPVVIAMLAVSLLAAGFIWIQLVLPLAGVGPDVGRWRLLALFVAGIPLLMLAAVIYLTIAGSTAGAPPGMALQNRVIALGASIAFVTGAAIFYRRLFNLLDSVSHTDPIAASWRDAFPALGLGGAAILFQLLLFN